jgi:hypothetical protein
MDADSGTAIPFPQETPNGGAMAVGRESKQEQLLAVKLCCAPADLRGKLSRLKRKTSYQGLSEELLRRYDVRVSDTWLWRYLNKELESA